LPCVRDAFREGISSRFSRLGVEEGVASGVGEEEALSLAEAVAELLAEGAGVGEHPLSVARRTSAHNDEK
jgi:hypothetical protein